MYEHSVHGSLTQRNSGLSEHLLHEIVKHTHIAW